MFVGRNDDGSIYGTWTVCQWDGQEELPDDHADVVAFQNRAPAELTAEQKLESLGITVGDLKKLLGI